MRELASARGGLYSSLSAVDADGVEGGYYLFDAQDLERALDDEERRVAGAAWGFDGNSPIEHGYLPIQAAESAREVALAAGLTVEETAARLGSARQKLLAVRDRRSLPRDEKRLAGWNGLALSALARAPPMETARRTAAPVSALVP